MPFTEHQGMKIYYEQHGQGPALVLVHGPGGHHASWWQQVSELKSDFTVITMDLRGFGSSSTTGDIRDARQHPADIVAVLEATGVRGAILLGQAIGATAALKVAMQRPDLVSGLILAHSLGGIADQALADLAARDRAGAQQLPPDERLMSKAFLETDPAKAFLFRQMGSLNYLKMADLQHTDEHAPDIEQVRRSGVRIAWLTGENDAVMGAGTVRHASELVPGSLLEIIPDAPHAAYWERPEDFNLAVRRLATTLGQSATATDSVSDPHHQYLS